MTFRIIEADCVDAMREMDENSVDAIVTDPPYDLTSARPNGRSPATEGAVMRGFMGLTWDGTGVAFQVATWVEALRVLKPGGHLLAFGGTRTYHRLVCAIEDAGFEIRDTLAWMYGSGFPKSLDVSKAIDKAAGAEREVVGTRRAGIGRHGRDDFEVFHGSADESEKQVPVTAPATEAAQQWQGWGTALKPAHEPIVLARKPLSEKNVAANVQKYGTGALNIDGTRVGLEGKQEHWDEYEPSGKIGYGGGDGERDGPAYNPAGRWPPNVVMDEEAGRMLDEQSGERPAGTYVRRNLDPTGEKPMEVYGGGWGNQPERGDFTYGDTGGASRFFRVIPRWDNEDLVPGDASHAPGRGQGSARQQGQEPAPPVPTRFRYVPKATRAEREIGLGHLPATRKGSNFGNDGPRPHTANDYHYEAQARNNHPTVKPIALMAWLCKLVTPPGGTVLDPFCGSGSTGIAALREGFKFIGIEKEPEYVEIARARIQGDAPLLNVEAT